MVYLTSFQVNIPKQVVATFDVRTLTLKGPKGEVSRDFNFALDIRTVAHGTALRVDVLHRWPNVSAKTKHIRAVIACMIMGCTRGYQCKLAFLILHLPIEIVPSDDYKSCEVHNYLGRTDYNYVKMVGDVTCRWSDPAKSEFVLSGPDFKHVLDSAHLVHRACSFKRKDLINYFQDTVEWNGEISVER